MHAFDFILVLFSFVFVCRDLVASGRPMCQLCTQRIAVLPHPSA